MKRSMMFVLVLCMAMVLVSSVALAAPGPAAEPAKALGPAPALTDVNIVAFTAENYDYNWQYTPTSFPKSMSAYSFSGPELYMSVIYTGYPNWNLTFIKVNGTQYTHSQLYYAQYPITSGGIVTGYEILYSIPAADLSASNTISVSSSGTNGGSDSDSSTNIKFTR